MAGAHKGFLASLDFTGKAILTKKPFWAQLKRATTQCSRRAGPISSWRFPDITERARNAGVRVKQPGLETARTEGFASHSQAQLPKSSSCSRDSEPMAIWIPLFLHNRNVLFFPHITAPLSRVSIVVVCGLEQPWHLAGVFVLERHIRRVRVGRVT